MTTQPSPLYRTLAPTAALAMALALSACAGGSQVRSDAPPAEAPVVIACCAIQSDYVMRCGHPAHLVDLPIAIEHMALQAVEEGLGSCWIGSFYEDQVKAILGIPAPVRVIQLLTLGYPRDSQRERNRLAIDEIACRDRWAFP